MKIQYINDVCIDVTYIYYILVPNIHYPMHLVVSILINGILNSKFLSIKHNTKHINFKNLEYAELKICFNNMRFPLRSALRIHYRPIHLTGNQKRKERN